MSTSSYKGISITQSILNKQPRYAITFMASVGGVLCQYPKTTLPFGLFFLRMVLWVVLEAAIKLYKLLTLCMLFKRVHVGSSYLET